MPPNIALATTTSALVAPVAPEKDQDEVFSWEQVYHYVCKYTP
jgi:hypothetical protein